MTADMDTLAGIATGVKNAMRAQLPPEAAYCYLVTAGGTEGPNLVYAANVEPELLAGLLRELADVVDPEVDSSQIATTDRSA